VVFAETLQVERGPWGEVGAGARLSRAVGKRNFPHATHKDFHVVFQTDVDKSRLPTGLSGVA